VVTFNPSEVFNPDDYGEDFVDLLVFVYRGKSLGRSPFDKALRSLDEMSRKDLGRDRGLLVSSCRGCSFYDELLDHWDLSEEELPVALLFPERREDSEKGKFRLSLANADDPLDKIVRFVEQFDAGELRPWLRGLAAPSQGEQEQSGHVTEVVASTFLDHVVYRKAYILLFLYGPFCGFSKQLQPVFQELGRQLWRAHSHLHLAKLDVTNNELPPGRWAVPVETNRVPRVYLFRPESTSVPEVYPPDGEKSVGALMSWLQPRLPQLDEWLAEPPGEFERGEF
jgi:thiol-disulfide isomerase/thioredoxin